jgi:hypothetical protein
MCVKKVTKYHKWKKYDEENSRDVHEQLLIGVTLQLGLVVQSLGPGLLDNGSTALFGRLWLE